MSYDPMDDEPEDNSELRKAMEPWDEDLDPDYDPTPQGEETVTDPYDAPSYKELWEKK